MQNVPIGFNNINVENTKTIDSRTYVYDLFFFTRFQKGSQTNFLFVHAKFERRPKTLNQLKFTYRILFQTR